MPLLSTKYLTKLRKPWILYLPCQRRDSRSVSVFPRKTCIFWFRISSHTSCVSTDGSSWINCGSPENTASKSSGPATGTKSGSNKMSDCSLSSAFCVWESASIDYDCVDIATLVMVEHSTIIGGDLIDIGWLAREWTTVGTDVVAGMSFGFLIKNNTSPTCFIGFLSWEDALAASWHDFLLMWLLLKFLRAPLRLTGPMPKGCWHVGHHMWVASTNSMSEIRSDRPCSWSCGILAETLISSMNNAPLGTTLKKFLEEGADEEHNYFASIFTILSFGLLTFLGKDCLLFKAIKPLYLVH